MAGTYGGTQPDQRDRRAIEGEIQSTRDQKHTANATLDVVNMRKKAAEHQHEAAAFFKKYRNEEATAVKLIQKANKMRRHTEEYTQKSKEYETLAAEMEAQFGMHTGAKLEKLRIKKAKYIEKSAKMKMKSAGKLAKAAKFEQKAAEHTAKSKEFLEKSKLNESEAKGYHDRADALEKAIGEQMMH